MRVVVTGILNTYNAIHTYTSLKYSWNNSGNAFHVSFVTGLHHPPLTCARPPSTHTLRDREDADDADDADADADG